MDARAEEGLCELGAALTQPGLALEEVPTLPLREAYDATDTINSKCTFAQATSDHPAFRHLALALKLQAHAILRMRKQA